MKLKSLFTISLIFLLVFFPFTVMASDGTGEDRAKVIGVDGKVKTDAIEKSENFTKPPHDDNGSKEPAINSDINSFSGTDSGMQAGEAMLVNAGVNLSYNLADQFLLSGVKINSLRVEEKKVSNDGSFKYSIFSKEINIFGIEAVNKILLLTGGAYLIGMLIIGALAYISFSIQSNAPKWFSKLRMELTGEEGYFDINDVLTVWGSELFGPIATFAFIFLVVNLRNTLVSGMVTDIATTITSTHGSLPSYFIACVTWYFNGLQRLTAQFGIYYFISMIFVQWIVANLIAVFVSVPKAIGLAIFNHLYFVFLILVDIETVFFIWFGTVMATETGYPELSIIGILVSFVIGMGLILSMPLYVVSRIYFRNSSTHFEVF